MADDDALVVGGSGAGSEPGGGTTGGTETSDSDPTSGAPATDSDSSFSDVQYSGTTPNERDAVDQEQVALPTEILELIEAGGMPRVELDTALLNQAQEPEPEQTTERDVSPTPLSRPELEAVTRSSQLRLELEHVDAVMKNYALWRDIDEMKRGIDESEQYSEEFVVKVAANTSAGLLAGVVAYTLRGGALVASLLGSLPLWSAYDPLPILGSRKKGEEEADDRREAEAGNTAGIKDAETLFE